MEHPDRLAVAAPLVQRARLHQRVLTVEMHESLHLTVDCLDPLEAGRDVFFRAQMPFGNRFCGFDRR